MTTHPGPREIRQRRSAAIKDFVAGERERRRAAAGPVEPVEPAAMRALDKTAYAALKRATFARLRGF